jgi:heme exporter protein CcmD
MAGLAEYLEMGGYARYVWPAYILVIAAIAFNIVQARRSLKRAREAAIRRLAAKVETQTPDGRPHVSPSQMEKAQ